MEFVRVKISSKINIRRCWRLWCLPPFFGRLVIWI